MSNENENERIDLTQFAGMTEGPWESEEWDEGKILGPILERHRNNHPVIAVVGNGWWGDMMPESDANKRAMAATPDLIAELKRCYEKIDWLMEIFPKSWCIECGNFLGKGELKPLQSNQIDECDHT
jgi:hypothetical protein